MTTSWTRRMAVGGMNRKPSSRRAGRSLQRVGPRGVRIDPERDRAIFAFAPDDWEILRQAVRKAGYRPGRVVVVEGKVPAPLPGGCGAGLESGTQEDLEQ